MEQDSNPFSEIFTNSYLKQRQGSSLCPETMQVSKQERANDGLLVILPAVCTVLTFSSKG